MCFFCYQGPPLPRSRPKWSFHWYLRGVQRRDVEVILFVAVGPTKALELRDGEPKRLLGKGVLKAPWPAF